MFYAKEYLQDIERASCRYTFMQESIYKTLKEHDVDAHLHIKTEKSICEDPT